MRRQLLLAACTAALAGCTSLTPAPVSDARKSSQVEKTPRVTAERSPATKKPQPPAAVTTATAEAKPIASTAPVVSRSLDERPLDAAAPSAPAAATTAPLRAGATADGETLKREPRGGKLPYSEENLARLKGREAAPVPPPVVPVTAPASAGEKPVPAANAPAPASAPAPAPSADIEWAWPAAGRQIAGFTEGGTGQEANKGLDLEGKIGDPVLAAAAGKVIYVGAMSKYGNLVIVLHAGGYSSVYAHCSKILVKETQMVTRGQKIAELGDSDADQPKLHFELRQQGKPTDPLKFLPAR